MQYYKDTFLGASEKFPRIHKANGRKIHGIGNIKYWRNIWGEKGFECPICFVSFG